MENHLSRSLSFSPVQPRLAMSQISTKPVIMLWISCCRSMRRPQRHERRKSGKEKTVILGNVACSLRFLPTALRLRQPYKARFITGLALGLAYGGVNSLFPLAIARVTSTIFPRHRSQPMAVRSNLHVLDTVQKLIRLS